MARRFNSTRHNATQLVDRPIHIAHDSEAIEPVQGSPDLFCDRLEPGLPHASGRRFVVMGCPPTRLSAQSAAPFHSLVLQYRKSTPAHPLPGKILQGVRTYA
jgi:hypothetical protein